MGNIKNFKTAALLLLMVFSLSVSAFAGGKDEAPGPRFKAKKEKLFDLELVDRNKKDVMISEFVNPGKVTVIAFFAEWCGPCQQELDSMNQLIEKWDSKFNTKLVAISLDTKNGFNTMKERYQAKNWKFNMLWDDRKEALGQLRIKNIPYLLIVDKSGYIVYEHLGYQPESIQALESHLENIK